ncbi:queuine tRNA-ribosyltransferase [Reticulomyxa filosa]|uniref:Queuine tRNA-ribosyltransferase n=1 Tax=Reticulomyxa filosa TaxID=46433 RepID=X6NY83_RETFI|nr:queuine tRNA-ribosyltransferase [Reticulomyxa filosa]|eukprot:ETO30794.1 queuine tRNA-ribosyltransferase [Reticulomyxa filosa]
MSGLEFKVLGKATCARRGQLKTRHGVVETPVFMPVGTQGAIKGVTFEEMNKMGCQILLCNTYHLGLRPDTKVIDSLGGIHDFKGWGNNVLTDSGGFQMVSLLELAEINEEGVKFQSPMDGTEMMLTPEKSMELQHEIGSDIMMALDDVVPAMCTDEKRFEEACYRTIRWIDRCIKAHEVKDLKNNVSFSQKQICLESSRVG